MKKVTNDICILGFNDLHIMQFLYKYTNILDEENIKYDVIYWNRSNTNQDVGFNGNPIPFNYEMNTYQPFYKKIKGFLKCISFMMRIIKKNKYKKLIVLTSQVAVPLFPILLRKYKGKFVYDYRDITKEFSVPFYKKMVLKLMNASAFVAISSLGFLEALGVEKTDNIIVSHNTKISMDKSYSVIEVKQTDPINIVYWGMVRQVEYNKKICDAFGKDNRFKLTYHGDGFYKELEQYCIEKGYDNIDFTGLYTQKDIDSFIKSTDILNCMYDNDITQKPAMIVKFYDSIRFRLPIVIQENSYLEKTYGDSSYCCAVDIDEFDFKEKIYEWFKKIDIEKAEIDFKNNENSILQDDMIFRDELIEFCQI